MKNMALARITNPDGKIIIQIKDRKDSREIDITSIQEVLGRLEKTLLNTEIPSIDPLICEGLREAQDLYETLNDDQRPYYVNRLLGILHYTSNRYKDAIENSEKVTQYKKFLKKYARKTIEE